MKLSEVKDILLTLETINFTLENGIKVPANFHITEVGVITKNFIDCGGNVRHEKLAIFQLWDANGLDHLLKPKKLLDIITLSEKALGMEDLEIEVEYQRDTIGKFDLSFNGSTFMLLPKTTNCLAPDKCGIPKEKLRVNLKELKVSNACIPGGGCC